MSNNTKEKTASQWILFKRILALAKFQQNWMIIAIVLTIFQSVITAFQPYLYKTVIDSVIIPKQFHLLEKWALILLGWLIVQAALGFANSYLSESIAQSVILKLRQYVYDHLTRLKLSFYDKTPVGTAVTRSISDIQTITDLFSSGVITIAGDLIQIVVILGCMFYMDVKLTLITLIVVPLFCSSLRTVFAKEFAIHSKTFATKSPNSMPSYKSASQACKWCSCLTEKRKKCVGSTSSTKPIATPM
jgi:ATP-binding cassette, subfamily B, multidrug efflux pump